MEGYLRKAEGVEVSRRRMVFNAQNSTYTGSSGASTYIEMNISDEHIDMDTVRVLFDFSATSGENVAPPKYAASAWMKQIKVKSRSGAQIGELMTDYNLARRVEYEMLNSTDQEASFDAVMEGADVIAPAASPFAARQYAHKLKDHIFSVDKYYPAKYHSGLVIEIDMEAPGKVLKYTGANPTYTISNLRIVCDLVSLRPEIEQALLQQLSQGGLRVHYTCKHVITSRITTGTSQRFDLGTVNGRVKDLQAVQVLDGAETSDDKLASFPYNNLSNYRFQLGSRFLTESEVKVSTTEQAEYLSEWTKSQGLEYLPKGLFSKAGLTPAILLSDKFVIGQKAEMSKSSEVLSSIRDKDQNKITLISKYSSAPDVGNLYVVANLDKELKLLPGRQFVDTDFNQ